MAFAPRTADFLNKMTYDSCSRPFWVYAATGFPAFLELWFTLSILDLEDLARSRGFSESAKDLGKGRRGRRHGGLILPPNQAKGVKRYSALGLRTLLIATIPLEIVGFTMLMYFSADRFFYRWSSLLENIKCIGEARTEIRQNSTFGMFPNPLGGAVNMFNLLQNVDVIESGAFSASVPFGSYDVTFAIEIDGDSPNTIEEYQIVMVLNGEIRGGNRLGTSAMIGAGQGGTLMFQGTLVFPFFGGGTIGWTVAGPAVPVGLSVASAHIMIHQLGGS